MSNSLRDQLLGLGFKAAPPPAKPARDAASKGPRRSDGGSAKRDGAGNGRDGDTAARRDARPAHRDGKPGERRDGRPPGRDAKPAGRRVDAPRRPRTQEEIDLAKAYALRAQKEKQERIAAEAARQEEARQRREARAKLAEFLKDKSLNDKDADIARHFPYGGKIKRIYVNAEQLRALNAGELGVVQLDGRYVLVTVDVLAEAESIFPQAVALKVDADAPAGDDPYSDPQYQVPDDLVW